MGHLHISFKQATARIRSLRLTGAFSQQELYNNWQAYQKLKIQIDLI